MNETGMTDNLRMIAIRLQVEIQRYVDLDGPPPIIDELKEVLNHITKAIGILEWDVL
tara:strand:+ start:308 stop:478 length:171 start_codon:yes stop_codon:yes gene_type:complete